MMVKRGHRHDIERLEKGVSLLKDPLGYLAEVALQNRKGAGSPVHETGCIPQRRMLFICCPSRVVSELMAKVREDLAKRKRE